MVDTMLAFFVTAAYLAGLSVDRARNRREALPTLLAGVLCGLATGSKYPGLLVVPTAVILVSCGPRLGVAQRVLRAVGVGAAAAVTFVAVMPAVLTNRQAVYTGVQANYDVIRQVAARGELLRERTRHR